MSILYTCHNVIDTIKICFGVKQHSNRDCWQCYRHQMSLHMDVANVCGTNQLETVICDNTGEDATGYW